MENLKNNSEKETRTHAGTAELRMDEVSEVDTADTLPVEGYAFLFNSRTDMGWYDEIIMPGAVTQEEINTMDVRCLLNHDRNIVLARSNKGEGTLSLTVDSVGLKYRFSVKPSLYPRFVENLRNKEITQSSFGFHIDTQRWVEKDGENELREIVRFKEIVDVSPVTYPAYTDTSVALRSHEKLKTEKQAAEDRAQALAAAQRKRELQLLELNSY